MKVYVVLEIVEDFAFYSEEFKGVFKTKNAAENYIYDNDENITFNREDDAYYVDNNEDNYYYIEECELQG